MTPTTPPAVRFAEKLRQDGDCWVWTAGLSIGGYGCFRGEGSQKYYAHRWSYEYHVGPIPDGLELDHLCRNRACANPYHLDPVTTRVNQLRGNGLGGRNARATHCPQGHAYTAENTLRESGGRKCRTCKNARQRKAAA